MDLLLIYVLMFIIIALLVIVMLRQSQLAKMTKQGENQKLHEDMVRIEGQLSNSARNSAELNRELRSEVSETLRQSMKTQSDQMLNASKLQTEALVNMQDRMVQTLSDTTETLRRSNEEKLDQIRGVVNEKLDKSLNERLDSSFKAIGDQLGRLYQSLGELEHLSEGVTDLNRTLSNVKTRGIWGEVQLSRILQETMAKSQYEENIATKKNSNDRVEFAIKFPAPDGGRQPVYLPIDSKFPADLYHHVLDASESGDPEAVKSAETALKNRILEEARTIRDKYVSPPQTTNYGIMFLPTEGLYAEVLRIDGLTEKCQEIGILIAGPTTITAILNSLQAGFKNVALSKKSVEVMKLLEAIKAQFNRMDAEVGKTQKKLSEAMSSTEKLQHRTQLITRRMSRIGEMDGEEAKDIIDLTNDEDFRLSELEDYSD